MKRRLLRLSLAGMLLSCLLLTACSGGGANRAPESSAPPSTLSPAPAEEDDAVQNWWLIEATDSKNFSYAVPSGGGSIEMTATLYFVAWKKGDEKMFGQYEGRALVALDMDLSKAGAGGISFAGGVLEDSISDNISFDLIPTQQDTVTAHVEDIDLAPLVNFVGQAEIMTDEYTISQQNWKALADGEVKLEVNGGFGDGKRIAQGFGLKAGTDTVQITIADFAAAYGLEAFSGTIIKSDTPPDALSGFRDAVMSRMEERLASGQSGSLATQETGSGEAPPQGGMTKDAQGREGMDTNGDGRLDIYFGEDGEVWADFDGDGNYEIAGADGVDN